MSTDPIVIVAAARTPLGRFQGDLSSLSANELGGHVTGEALRHLASAAVRQRPWQWSWRRSTGYSAAAALTS